MNLASLAASIGSSSIPSASSSGGGGWTAVKATWSGSST